MNKRVSLPQRRARWVGVLFLITMLGVAASASAQLTVSEVVPNTGLTMGGTAVALSGTGFEDGAAVTFGSLTANDITVQSTIEITCTTPAGVGVVDVVVTVGLESVTLENGFTYTNTPPVAEAGDAITDASVGVEVELDGSASSDYDLDDLTYSWTQTDGETVTITGSTTARPTFTPASKDLYEFQLIVYDGTDYSDPDFVTVAVIYSPPDISCPTDPSASADHELQFVVSATDPEDNDVTIRIEQKPAAASFADDTFTWTPGCDDIGPHTVRFIASDGALEDTCEVVITVSDDDAPEFTTRPGNMTVDVNEGECFATIAAYGEVASDNCGVTEIIYSHQPGSYQFDEGTTKTVTITAKDAALNEEICTFDVEVNSVSVVLITKPDTLRFDHHLGAAAPPAQNDTVFNTGCKQVNVNCSKDQGWLNKPGNVSIAPKDSSVYSISVDPRGLPEGQYSGKIVFNPSGDGTPDTLVVILTVSNAGPGFSDCPITQINFAVGAEGTLTLTASDPDGDPLSMSAEMQDGGGLPDGAVFDDTHDKLTWTPTCAQIGPYYFRFIVTDGAEADTCPVTIVVADTEPPVAKCPGDIVKDTDPDTCGAVVYFSISATDNCPDTTVIADPPSGSFFAKGTNEVEVIATDAVGNADTCYFDVTINDSQSPVAKCPGDIVKDTDPDTCGAVVYFSISATDNCPDTTVIADPPSGSFFAKGTNPVEVIATDAAGNADTCYFDVTVVDSEPPVVECPPAIIDYPTDAGECGANVSFTIDKTDNCTGASVVSHPISGSFFAVGTHPVEVIATDAAGNADTCYFDVTVFDSESPVAECPGDIIKNTDPDQCRAIVTFITTVDDNCLGATVIADPPSGSFFAKGTNEVEVIATDASGNADTCYFDITVEDRENPLARCPGPIKVETDTGECGAVVSFEYSADDNCPGATAKATPNSGSFFAIGQTTVNVRATDASGNIDDCSFIITVDNPPPEVSSDGRVECSVGSECTFKVYAHDRHHNINTLIVDPASKPPGSDFTTNLAKDTGTFIWTPASNQGGKEWPVDFIATDDCGADSSTKVKINVDYDRHSPDIDSIKGVPEGSVPNTITLAVYASDPDGDPITLTMDTTGTPVPQNSFTDNGDGTGNFEWTPAERDTGKHLISFCASDASSTDCKKVELSVAIICTPPVIKDQTKEMTIWSGGGFGLDLSDCLEGPKGGITWYCLDAPTYFNIADSSTTGEFAIDVDSNGVFSELVRFDCTNNCGERSKKAVTVRFTQLAPSEEGSSPQGVKVLTFGNVLIGYPESIYFEIFNPGTVPVKPSFTDIDSIDVTPRDGGSVKVIPGGGIGEYKITWNPGDITQTTGEITIGSDQTTESFDLQLSGWARRFVLQAPSAVVNFDTVNCIDSRATAVEQMDIELTGNIGCKLEEIAVDNPANFTATSPAVGTLLNSGDVFTLSLEAHPRAEGNYSDEVAAYCTVKLDDDNIAIDTVLIQLNARGEKPACVASPPLLEFSGVDTGSVSTLPFTIQNDSPVIHILDHLLVDPDKYDSSLNVFTIDPTLEFPLSIPAHDSAVVLVSFTPPDLDFFRANLLIEDSLDGDCNPPVLTGTGVLTELVPDETVELGAIELCQAKEGHGFEVEYRRGDSALIIDDIYPETNSDWLEFTPSLDGFDGSAISPLGKITFDFTVSPRDTGSTLSSREIWMKIKYHIESSSEPKSKRFPLVQAWGDAGILGPRDTLDFGSVEIGQSENKPATLDNIGGFNLSLTSVEKVDGPFSVSGTSWPTIAPGGTQDVTIQFMPTALGEIVGRVAVRHTGYKFPWDPADPTAGCDGTRLDTIVVSGRGVDTTDPDIGQVEPSDSGHRIDISVTDNLGVDLVVVQWRPGNAPVDYPTVEETIPPNGDVWSFSPPSNQFPPESIRKYGYEVLVRAVDLNKNDDTTGWISISGKFDSSYWQQSISSWLGTDDSLWHLVSIPGDLNTWGIDHIFDSLSGLPPNYGRGLTDNLADDWRLVSYTPTGPSAGTYEALPSGYDDTYQAEPGTGYWFRQIGLGDLTLRLPAGSTMMTTEPFSIQLDEGWNLIGNPFFFDVWIDTDNLDLTAISSLVRQSTPVSPGESDWWADMSLDSALKPWYGYAIKCEHSTCTIKLNPHFRPGNSSPKGPTWIVPITLQDFDEVLGRVTIGQGESSYDGPDALDSRPVEFFGAQPKLVLHSQEYGRFARDIRGTAELQEWRVDLEVRGIGHLMLSWDATQLTDDDQALLLRDIIADRVIDMTRQSSYNIENSVQLPPGRFRIYYGTPEQVEQAAGAPAATVPNVFQLYQNYPNPFNPSTAIAFDLPSDGPVTLEIYNILGARVRTLIDEFRVSGSHVVLWNGRGADGRRLGSGIYFARMTAGGYGATVKLALVR